MNIDSGKSEDPYLEEEDLVSQIERLSPEERIFDFRDDPFKSLRERFKEKKVSFQEAPDEKSSKSLMGQRILLALFGERNEQKEQENPKKEYREKQDQSRLPKEDPTETLEDRLQESMNLNSKAVGNIDDNVESLNEIMKKAIARTSDIVNIVDIFGEATIKREEIQLRRQCGIREIENKMDGLVKSKEKNHQREDIKIYSKLNESIDRGLLLEKACRMLIDHILGLYDEVLIPNILWSNLKTNKTAIDIITGDNMMMDEKLENTFLETEKRLNGFLSSTNRVFPEQIDSTKTLLNDLKGTVYQRLFT
ncbi:hypothetical protein FOA43_003845 [Brettanomyces nanus]|uniref:Uncharacterized protein n=1 Tax=Eeniella nana TaxID=13502 RepID=A0A875S586_EENNA|nr:uncharacterized protein FOA43_003845 [Brettanomyces nanus]QPG76456.1 hypothetical protein FOA43_003845 [Brettanomyces nanus]